MPLSLRSQYAYIPASIRAGFSMGPLQPPVSTILHPNHYKADRQLSIDSWASKSKAAGFIAGPWPVDEVVATVGPVHAAPISIVDKFDQGVLVKERIVYDASYPQPRPGRPSPSIPSINSQIRKDDYPCEWMTAVETKHLFRTVPPYARFAGFDLKDAFQQVGNSPSQRTLFCVHVLGMIYVWLVGIFGLRSICGIFGALCDVTCWYIEYCFPDLLLRHYVDDFLLVDLAPPSSAHANRSFSLLLDAVRAFGWEIHPEKHFSWTRSFTFLGFDWDFNSRSVTLSPRKHLKFQHKLSSLLEPQTSPGSSSPSLRPPQVLEKDVASVIGSCQHVCVVAPHRRSKLNGLYAFRNSFRGTHPGARQYLTTAALREVKDWYNFFDAGPISCSLDSSTTFFPLEVYTDASDYALGVVLGDKALYIPLPPDYTSRPGINIGVGEAWAFELGIAAAVAAGASGHILVCHVDNQGVVFSVRRGRSRNNLVNEAIDRAAEFALSHNVELSIRYVRSADNFADAPSRADTSGYSPLVFPFFPHWHSVLAS
ncbi:hypothetical protein A4X13_0g2206 [Tilletia indica]|uniref:Uncharacterized protein n=1 Tax=Tilletia indica TaxID=43049 RepID=A0A177TQW2_9BASI|nr:hypothetical protein A4X13_0g2206 [Tilletia indica]